MGPIPLTFDVTEALAREVTQGVRASIAAWLFVPDAPLGPRPVVMALLNGGSYDKRYFHAEIPGHSGYSAAEYLAALGNIVLLPDHLGIGESSRVADDTLATRQIVARANHAASKQFLDRLGAGDLHPRLPALHDVMKIGGGHSMGGMQIITQQAEFASYDAVMILGYTLLGVHLTIDGVPTRADSPSFSQRRANTPQEGRAALRETFHWDDVPADVIAADEALAVPTPANIGLASLKTDVIKDDAAKIAAPVFLCFGERDVSPDPHGEPACYRGSPDITLHLLARSGHCHHFASTRYRLWNRMHHWAGGIDR
jgi:alpha-beta hydrolase superfamily lysophospholipase